VVERFVRQVEGEEVVIGMPERGAFLALPRDAVEILDEIASGRPTSEIAAEYEERHGVVPDIDGLLGELERRGFVRRAADGVLQGASGEPVDTAPAEARFHFEWIPRRWARTLWSPPVVAACWLAVLAAAVLMLFEPELRPTYRSAFFAERTIPFLGLLMLLGLATTFCHEMAHLLAAHARGVSCRFGIGNRMWFVVWETDMTGVWALPRRQRFLPIVAGPFADLTGAALLILFQAAAVHGLVALHPLTLQVVRALVFIYVMRIAWQFYLFLRTDFYYVFATAFGCRNLMGDARAHLGYLVRRLLGRPASAPPAPPTQREARAVRAYAWLWLVGRTVALSILLFVQFPLFWLYLQRFGQMLGGHDTGTDTMEILTGLLFVLFLTWGLTLWIREIWRSRTKETQA